MTNFEELKLCKLQTKTGTFMGNQTQVGTNPSNINTRQNKQHNLNLDTSHVC